MRRSLARARRTSAPSDGSRVPAILAAVVAAVVFTGVTATGILGLTAATTVGVLSADLPDPSRLANLSFAQPTIVYDRTGEVELARFQREDRRVVAYDDLPHLVLDATTTAEDRTFWDNSGFDPGAIMSAIAEQLSGEGERGASTITQQLVRARLLPEDVTAPGSDRYLRKAKELIQSARLTEAFPGERGKEEIVTAYLNEIFYGHGAYGIAAAAKVYFGVGDLDELTPAQAALLAGLPQAPSTYDPFRYAERGDDGLLRVPADSPPVIRRDWILRNIGSSRWTNLTRTELRKALAEPVILAEEQPSTFRAPHFTWQVRRQLETILGPDADIDTGGYRVITSLDWAGQQLAERWLAAAVIAPNLPADQAAALLDGLEIPRADREWISRLRGKDLHNAALVAMDYRTGDVLAYAGSAGYYRDDLASAKFEPKYDAAGDGMRQPGSAWKPIVYSTAFDQKSLTPGSLLLDITTEFDPARQWAPRDADQLDRGPVLVRQALQYSLNVPAIRALGRVGSEAVATRAEALGIRFAAGRDTFLQAGLSGAIGTVEVRPLDLTSAYGALGNGGIHVPERMILEVLAPDGSVVYQAGEPAGEQVVSPQAAFLVSDILAGNTDPAQNPIWAKPLRLTNGPDGAYRPAAVKTGTANDARDLATYGFLPPPAEPAAPGLAVGIWMGNSDHSMPATKRPATSLTAAAPLWHAFVRDYTAGQPVAAFTPPSGVVQATIDRWSGGAPGPWTRATRTEWFIDGTQPGGAEAVDQDGLLYTRACGGWRVDPVKAELGPQAWDADVADWAARARRGTGVKGEHDSRTAYFWGERSWGGQIVGRCPAPKPTPPPTADPSADPSHEPPGPPPDNGDGGGRGGGGGGGGGGGDGGGGGGGNDGAGDDGSLIDVPIP